MKLTVRNVARISIAEIELGGITVIAGPNGTGKSTISRSLMTLSSVSRNISELVQVERIKSIFISLRKSFAKHGADFFYPPNFLQERRNDWPKWLSRDWWQSAERPIKWILSDQRLILFPEDFKDSENLADVLADARADIFLVLGRSDAEYVDFICKKSVAKAFNKQVKPIFLESGVDSEIKLEDSGAEILFRLKDGELYENKGIGRSFVPSTIYIEPLSYVDFVNSPLGGIQDRYTARRFFVCNAVANEPIESGLSIEESNELSDAKMILDRIVSTIRGLLIGDKSEIKRGDKNGIRFSERFLDGKSRAIDVQNIASGMKAMAAIVRMTENRSIRRGSMLIIDEPETNLHPDWQVQFADFLVRFSNDFGVTLLINTHSPYFLQAIWKFTNREGVKGRFYNMIQDGESDSFTADDVSSNIDCIFKTMAAPFNNLIGE